MYKIITQRTNDFSPHYFDCGSDVALDQFTYYAEMYDILYVILLKKNDYGWTLIASKIKG